MHLHVLYASEVPAVLIADQLALRDRFVDADIEQGRAQLSRLLGALRGKGIAIGGEVRAGFAPDVILEAGASGRYDLVVVGTHGRTGVRRRWMGSVAERVLRSSTIPVLTVRSP